MRRRSPTIAGITLFLCHLLKIPDDWVSSQLVNDLLPRFSFLPSSSWSLCLCLWALSVPEICNVHSCLPGHGPSAQQAMNQWAALTRRGVLWRCCGEKVLWVGEVVPVHWGGRKDESIWRRDHGISWDHWCLPDLHLALRTLQLTGVSEAPTGQRPSRWRLRLPVALIQSSSQRLVKGDPLQGSPQAVHLQLSLWGWETTCCHCWTNQSFVSPVTLLASS